VIQKPDSSSNELACSCGRSLTLTCTLEEHKFAVAWMNANNITSIAQCVQQSCNLNPVYLGQYTFSSDVDRNIFNLTIIKVSMKDNGRKLVCSDGSNIGSQILKVTSKYSFLIIHRNFESCSLSPCKNGKILY
jgi:hypothetical protein